MKDGEVYEDNMKDEEVSEDNVVEGDLEENMTARNSDQVCGRMDKLLRHNRSLHSPINKLSNPKSKRNLENWRIVHELAKGSRLSDAQWHSYFWHGYIN